MKRPAPRRSSRLPILTPLLALLILGSSESFAADDLATRLSSKDSDVRRAAWESATSATDTEIPSIVELLDSEDRNTSLAAKRALETWALRGSSPATARTRKARIEQLLVQTLADATRSTKVRSLTIDLLGIVGGAESVPTLVRAFVDDSLRERARRSLERIPGPEASRALVALLEVPIPDAAISVARSLGVRRDGDTLDALLGVASDAERAIGLRVACVDAACRLGEGRAAAIAFEVLEAARPHEPRELTDALLELAELLRRSNPATTEILCDQIRRHSLHEPQRLAALQLGTRDPTIGALPFLLGALEDSSKKVRELAARRLASIDDAQANARLLEHWESASGTTAAALLRALFARQADGHETLVEDATRSDDVPLRVAALEIAGVLESASLASALETRLIVSAKKGQGEIRHAALESLELRAGRKAHSNDFVERRAAGRLFATIFRYSTSNETRARSLVSWAKSGRDDVVPAIAEARKSEVLVEAADRAEIAFAQTLPARERRDEAIRLLQSTRRESKSLGAREQAAAALFTLDVDPVPESGEEGFVGAWRTAGPLSEAGGQAIERAHIAGRKDPVAWEALVSLRENGVVDLTQLLGLESSAIIYASVRIESPDARSIYLRTGSDRDLDVWLNGRKLVRYRGERPLRADADTVEANLVAGENRLLVKYSKTFDDGGLGLFGSSLNGFILRLSTLDGHPIDLRTFRKRP